MAHKVCFTGPDAAFGSILLTQQGRDNFTVTYGSTHTTGLTYAEAAKELGSCLMHQAACDDKLDAMMKGER